MEISDFAAIAIYLALIFSIGLAFTRRAHRNTDSYFLSGRSLPWWIAGTSMVATSFSCDTPLYVTRLVRSGGIWLNWQWWSFAIGGLFGAFLLARLWRRAKVVTDVELTELRYGAGAGRVLRLVRAGWISLIINTITMSWVVLAMSKIIGAVWGGPKLAGVLLAAALAVVYSLLAGFWGVVITDVAQFIIALAGAVVLAIFSVNAAGGMENILAVAGPERITLIPAFPEGGLFSADLWMGAFGGFLIYSSIQWWANLNSDGGGKVIQRMSAAKNEAHAFGATLWFNLAHYALRTWPWVIAALASLVILPNIKDDEMAYPMLMMIVMPSPWKGILIAGLIAAFMSTIDTHLNWGSSYLTHDLYRNWLRPGRSEKHYIRVAKVAMSLLIVLTVLMAYMMTSVTEAFKFLIAFGAGTGPVYILRWFWWRIGAWGEISAMAASTVISSALYLFWPEVPFTLKVVMITAGSAAVFVPVTFLTRPAPMKTLVEFYRRTRPSGAWGPGRAALARESGDITGGASIGLDAIGWMGGVGLTLGATFAGGLFIFGRMEPGITASLVAVAGGIVVAWWMKRSFR